MKILENSIILTGEELEEFSYEAIDTEITGQTRWETHREGIIEVEDKFYLIYWNSGSTEMQDSEMEGGEFQEVIKKKVVVEKWMPKK